MLLSEQANELFAALSKMQAELTSASKSRSGHGYKYADLAECINTAKEPLANNGLAVTQLMGGENETTLITVLTHSSGQYIASEFVMGKAVLMGGAGKNPAQEMGASITYMRRYAYAAIIGLAQEDDDAAGCKKPQPKKPAQKPQYDAQKAFNEAKAIVASCDTENALEQAWKANSAKWSELGIDESVLELAKARKKEINA